MNGVSLSLNMYEFQKHHGMVLYRWILEFAKENGIEGGAAYRAIAGYGRHGKMHEEHFFELASNVPLQVIFVSEKDKIHQFIEKLKLENIHLFYVISEVDFGILSK
jgi:PII-like signaling protein